MFRLVGSNGKSLAQEKGLFLVWHGAYTRYTQFSRLRIGVGKWRYLAHALNVFGAGVGGNRVVVLVAIEVLMNVLARHACVHNSVALYNRFCVQNDAKTTKPNNHTHTH